MSIPPASSQDRPPTGENSLREKVERELARYEHPLLRFSTEERRNGVTLMIDLREGLGFEHHYEINLHEREITNAQFPWTFQKLLYDCLHDFIVEMFERNPQMKE
ncbi:MAG: hypothetical protein ACE145_10380 [Terriglobia bacterium]